MTRLRLAQELEHDPAPKWVLTRGLALHACAIIGAVIFVWIRDAAWTLPWLVGGWLLWELVFVTLGLRAWLLKDARAYRPLTMLAGGDVLWVAMACLLSLAGPGAPYLALVMVAIWAAAALWHIRAAQAVPLQPLIRKMTRDGLLRKTNTNEIEWRGFPIWKTSPDFDKSDQIQKLMNYYAPTAIAFTGLVVSIGALVVGSLEVGLSCLGITFFGVALGMNETTRLFIIANRLNKLSASGALKL